MTVVPLYVSVNWVKSMCSGHISHNFSCCDDLSKFGKEYLNSLKCQFCTFFSIKLRKLWHTARLSRTNRHKVIKSEKQSGFFWPTVYILLLKQKTVSGSGITWVVCKSAPRSRQITTPAPHHSVFLQAECPSCRSTNSIKALKVHEYVMYENVNLSMLKCRK